MKRCPSCKQEKPLSEFGRNRAKPNGLSDYCKLCKRLCDNRWYRDNKHRLVSRDRAPKVRNRAWKRKFFEGQGCQWVDCIIKDADILEFNHIRDKQFDLSFLIQRGYSIKRIEAEARKGFVLCANHHRKWTILSRKSEPKGLLKYLKPSVVL